MLVQSKYIQLILINVWCRFNYPKLRQNLRFIVEQYLHYTEQWFLT